MSLMDHERRFRAVREMSAYPDSGGIAGTPQPPLGANVGLMQCSKGRQFDHLVGAAYPAAVIRYEGHIVLGSGRVWAISIEEWSSMSVADSQNFEPTGFAQGDFPVRVHPAR